MPWFGQHLILSVEHGRSFMGTAMLQFSAGSDAEVWVYKGQSDGEDCEGSVSLSFVATINYTRLEALK